LSSIHIITNFKAQKWYLLFALLCIMEKIAPHAKQQKKKKNNAYFLFQINFTKECSPSVVLVIIN
jgi:hypothetical protein